MGNTRAPWSRWFLPALTVVLLGVAWWAWRARSESPRPPANSSAPAVTAHPGTPDAVTPSASREPRNAVPPPDEPAPGGLGFQAGQRLVYDFSQSRQITLGMRQPPQGPGATAITQEQNLTTTQRGRLVVKVQAEIHDTNGPAGWLMACQWEHPEIEMEVGTPSDAEQQRQMQQALAAVESELAQGTVLVAMARSGRIQEPRAIALASQESRDHWLDILARWQVVLADDPAALQWEAAEEDPTGSYLAQYRSTGTGPARHLVKKKLRYTEISLHSMNPDTPAEDDGPPPSSAIRGETAIDLNPYPQTIAGDETLLVVASSMFSIKGRASFRFQLTGRETRAAGAALSAADVARQLGGAGVDLRQRRAEDRQWAQQDRALTPESMEDLVAQLKRLIEAGGAQSTEELALAAQLIAAVRAGGTNAVAVLLECLTDDPTEHDYAAVLIGVLAAANTPDAHRGLLEIIADPSWPLKTRELALESSIQTTHPAPEADAVLKTLSAAGGPLADTALLTLGATGDYVRGTDTNRYHDINAYVAEQIGRLPDDPAAEDRGRTLLLLDTVANLGPPEVPPLVARAYTNEEAYVRDRAVWSLNRIFSPVAEAMVMNALTNDADAQVRTTALRVAGAPARTNALAILRETAVHHATPALRIEAISLMTVAWAGNTGVVCIVQSAAVNDPSEEVRAYAAEWLQVHAVPRDLAP